MTSPWQSCKSHLPRTSLPWRGRFWGSQERPCVNDTRMRTTQPLQSELLLGPRPLALRMSLRWVWHIKIRNSNMNVIISTQDDAEVLLTILVARTCCPKSLQQCLPYRQTMSIDIKDWKQKTKQKLKYQTSNTNKDQTQWMGMWYYDTLSFMRAVVLPCSYSEPTFRSIAPSPPSSKTPWIISVACALLRHITRSTGILFHQGSNDMKCSNERKSLKKGYIE